MIIQHSLWLLRLMLIWFLQYSVECRRYDRCSTREGRVGICVAKRFCREATTSSREVLTACSGESGVYCCPVPTPRSSESSGSLDHAPAVGPIRSTSTDIEKSTHRPSDSFETPKTHHRPEKAYPEPSYSPSLSSSSASQEETYRYPERTGKPPETRVKQHEHSDSGADRLHDDVRFDDREQVPARRPDGYDEQDRQHVPHSSTKRPAVQRPVPPPSRNSDRRPPEEHFDPSSSIRFPEEHVTRGITTRRPSVQRSTPSFPRNKDREPPERRTELTSAPIKFPEEYRPPHPPAPACGQKPYELFIAGGEESKQHEWPWMVAIFRRHASPKPNTYICGGSLINSRYILTAAHCFVHNYVILPASTFVVRLGAHFLDSGEDYTVSNLVVHHNHSGSEFFNDIALIRLASEVYFTDKIAPICLPSREMRFKTFVDRMATVAGWGSTAFFRTADSRVLQHVSVPVLSNEECASAYSRVRGAAFLARGTDHIICAGLREGGKDACLGDSGGPLMLKTVGDSWTVIGIVSLGYKCAEPGYPGVYTRVTHYLNWIYSNMKNS